MATTTRRPIDPAAESAPALAGGVSPEMARIMAEALKDRAAPMSGAAPARPEAEPGGAAPPAGRAEVAQENAAVAGRVPDSPEGYRLERPELPEGAGHDRVLEAQAREWLHRAGVDVDTAVRIARRYHAYALDRERQSDAALAESRAITEATLRDEWGADFERKLRGARALVHDVGGDTLAGLLSATGLGNDVELLRLAARLAERAPDELGPKEIEAEIARLIRREGYGSRAHPDHARLVDRVHALFRAAASE